jgi:hypothetical protein
MKKRKYLPQPIPLSKAIRTYLRNEDERVTFVRKWEPK